MKEFEMLLLILINRNCFTSLLYKLFLEFYYKNKGLHILALNKFPKEIKAVNFSMYI